MIDPNIERIEEELAQDRAQIALANGLKNLTPQQAVDYVEANVTTLAQAKTILKLMVRILIVLLHRDEHLT
jgi:hypothetical protein